MGISISQIAGGSDWPLTQVCEAEEVNGSRGIFNDTGQFGPNLRHKQK